MSNNFQQTVDLRDRLVSRRKQASPKKVATPLEKIYRDEEPGEPIKDLQKISQPIVGRSRDGLTRSIIFVLAILAAVAMVYLLFFRHKSPAPDWYAITLVDGEVFYGQITNIKADPVYIANVYYNYDQAKGAVAVKDQTKTVAETGSLILVKRGKETYGPDGSMNVVRSQVLFMEPLKDDSKVLQAILQYEK